MLFLPVEKEVRPRTHCEVKRWVAEHAPQREGCRHLADCDYFTTHAWNCFSKYPHRGAHDRLLRMCCQLRPLTEQSALVWLEEHAEYTKAGEFKGWPMMRDSRALVDVVLKATELIEPVYAHMELLQLSRILALYQSLRKDVNVYHHFRAVAAQRARDTAEGSPIADDYSLVLTEYLQFDSGRAGAHDPFNPAACKAIAMNMPEYQEADYSTIAALVRFVGGKISRQTVARTVKDMGLTARKL